MKPPTQRMCLKHLPDQPWTNDRMTWCIRKWRNSRKQREDFSFLKHFVKIWLNKFVVVHFTTWSHFTSLFLPNTLGTLWHHCPTPKGKPNTLSALWHHCRNMPNTLGKTMHNYLSMKWAQRFSLISFITMDFIGDLEILNAGCFKPDEPLITKCSLIGGLQK